MIQIAYYVIFPFRRGFEQENFVKKIYIKLLQDLKTKRVVEQVEGFDRFSC